MSTTAFVPDLHFALPDLTDCPAYIEAREPHLEGFPCNHPFRPFIVLVFDFGIWFTSSNDLSLACLRFVLQVEMSISRRSFLPSASLRESVLSGNDRMHIQRRIHVTSYEAETVVKRHAMYARSSRYCRARRLIQTATTR